MALEFKLPDIGEGIAEGEITRWHVQEGQTVKENDPFVEVMTDKATVEISAPASGRIASIKFPAGATVPVGSVIAVIEGSGAAAKAASSAAAPPAAAPPPAAPTAPARSAAAAAAAPALAPSPKPVAAPAPAPVAVARADDHGNGGLPGGRVLAAPAIRRRARELGIDLREVAGSGPAGRVSGVDLEQHLKSAGARAGSPAPAKGAAAPAPAVPRAVATAPAPIPGGATEERLPLRGIRKRIAERMHKSKSTAAHFTYVDELDATQLVEARDSLKEEAAARGVKLTYMPFIVAATVAALKQFPLLNSALDDEKQEIVVKHCWHVGFACDTDQGLVVPVIKDADRRSLLNLGAAVQDLTARARAGKLALDEVTGSTFTITNAGNIGGILATPVINWPEVAILGVHKIADRAVVRDGAVVVRKMMNLSVSIDHRVVDGAVGARFMNELIRLLEDPRRLLLGSL